MDSAEKVSLATVQAIYEAFNEGMYKSRKEARFGDRFSRWFTGRGKDDALQARFAEQVEEAMQNLAAQDPDPAQVREILQFIYTAHAGMNTTDPESLMLLAVHRYTNDLIPLLSKQDAASLREQYEKALPRRERLPVNDQVLKALREREK